MYTFKIKNFLEKNGFTLMEVIIAVIIAGILASVAIPKYSGMAEKSRAAEGAYILGTLLSAQERYSLENGNYTSTIGDLDVEIPRPKNFNDPTVSNGCALAIPCAVVKRLGGGYELRINGAGDVSCNGSVSACARAGY